MALPVLARSNLHMRGPRLEALATRLQPHRTRFPRRQRDPRSRPQLGSVRKMHLNPNLRNRIRSRVAHGPDKSLGSRVEPQDQRDLVSGLAGGFKNPVASPGLTRFLPVFGLALVLSFAAVLPCALMFAPAFRAGFASVFASSVSGLLARGV